MAYTQNIPTASQRQKDSQPLIQANFQGIKTLIDVNHVTFDDPSGNQGKHKFVTFPLQSSVPAISTNEMVLFEKIPAAPFPLTAVPELFLKRNIVAGSELPITASGFGVPTSVANQGWTYLPSGILLKYGKSTLSASSPGVKTVDLSVIGPAYTSAIYSVSLTYLTTGVTSLPLKQTGAGNPLTEIVVVGDNAKEFTFITLGR